MKAPAVAGEECPWGEAVVLLGVAAKLHLVHLVEDLPYHLEVDLLDYLVEDLLNHLDHPSWGEVDPQGGLERRLELLGPQGHIGRFRDDL